MSLGAALAVLVPTLNAGCGSGGSSGPNNTVSGQVTYNGAPVENGYIKFVPAGAEGTPMGGPINNGAYTVRGTGMGKRTVDISSMEKRDAASTGDTKKPPKALIPPNAKGNKQSVEITADRQQLDFHLTGPKVK